MILILYYVVVPCQSTFTLIEGRICLLVSEVKSVVDNFCVNAKYISGNRYPAGIYLLKVNNRNTRTRCEICSKLTIKTPERRH